MSDTPEVEDTAVENEVEDPESREVVTPEVPGGGPDPRKFVEAPRLVSEVAAAADAEHDRLASEAPEGTSASGQVTPALQTPLYRDPRAEAEAEGETEAEVEAEQE